MRWLRRLFTQHETRATPEPEPDPIPAAGGPADSPFPASPALKKFDPDAPLFLEILADNGGYLGGLHQGCREQAFPLGALPLGPEVKPFQDRDWTLQHLVTAIRGFEPADLRAFDERAQLDLGRWFYDHSLGRLPPEWRQEIRQQQGLDLRVLSRDEWIAALPWNLLADESQFLSISGWDISSAHRPHEEICVLPPAPRLLIVAPQPAGRTGTCAEAHIAELQALLSEHDPRFSFDDRLRLARTWSEFQEQVEDFQPQIVYYYGHGDGDSRKCRLLFAEGPKLREDARPVMDFAQTLRRLPRPPLLAYINCCLGDAGGFLGVGRQLGQFIPAVLTNRTVAEIPIARQQALDFWRQVLLEAVPPHQAAGTLYAGVDLTRLGFEDIRWITPVLHCHYADWQAKAPAPRDRLVDDPHWHLKIDRVQQYSTVETQSNLMLREQRPKSLAFIWYGREGDGVELFHERLRVELNEALRLKGGFIHKRPRWPEHFGEDEEESDYHAAFSDAFCEAFEIAGLDEIPQAVRAEHHGKQSLIYIRHEPVRSPELINPDSLKKYLQWWDRVFVPKLGPKQYALLTVSFLVSKPLRFQQRIKEERIEEMPLDNTVPHLLDELETLAQKDLLRFARTHNLDLPRDRLGRVFEEILKRTGGRYELTVEALKQVRREVWREHEDDNEKNAGEKKNDY